MSRIYLMVQYCPGIKDAVTPDIRDARTQRLYDSTVGLLGNDSMSNPSIFVTYHDAQAYPEVSEAQALAQQYVDLHCFQKNE